jgi:hypothetical protein
MQAYDASARHEPAAPWPQLAASAAPEGLQLGFAAVDPPQIRRGVGDLAAALAEEAGAN